MLITGKRNFGKEELFQLFASGYHLLCVISCSSHTLMQTFSYGYFSIRKKPEKRLYATLSIVFKTGI